MGVAAAIGPEPVPLVRDRAGRLVVTGTRVPLDSLVAAFKQGDSPEGIHESYETVSLADVYSVLTYYLRHPAEVEAYLAERANVRAEFQKFDEARFPSQNLRANLLARRDR